MSGSIWLAVAVEAAEDVGEMSLGIDRIEFAGLQDSIKEAIRPH